MFKDIVRILDTGFISLKDRAGRVYEALTLDSDWEKPVIEVKGWVQTLMRERGKIVAGSKRDGFNIWTNTGREYCALRQTIQTPPTTPYRSDTVAYLGVGTGFTIEDPNITNLVGPVAFSSGQFLTILDPATFPLSPTRTSVRYTRTYVENEITTTAGSSVLISELGLFTNGSPTSNFTPGTRDTTLLNASSQAPVAYKSFDSVQKRDTLQFEVSWEIRY